MHELTITQNIVEIASEKAEGRRVSRVSLQIGDQSAVEPDAIRFCFDVCARDSLLEDAVLQIETTAGFDLLIKEIEVI